VLTKLLAIRALSQRDPVWARKKLGFSQGSIGDYGCAVTALAMVLNYIDAELLGVTDRHTPATVNAALRVVNGFRGKYRNSINWPAVPAVWPLLEYDDRVDCANRLAHKSELKEIDDRLAHRTPVIIYVDARKSEPGLQQHFVLIVGQDTDTGVYRINDPWHGDMAQLCPRYGATPARAICGIILFDRIAKS